MTTPVDDLTADINELLDSGRSAQQIAQELIVPLNDVLTVAQQRRHAAQPASPPPSRPGLAVVPEETVPMTTPPPTTMVDLLSRAGAIDDPKIRRATEKTRDAFDQLRGLVATYEQQAEARTEVARLEKALAEAKAKLGGSARRTSSTKTADNPSGGKSTRPAYDGGPPSSVVREWATEQGVDFPAHGMLPNRVIDAYRAAHGDAS